MNVVGVRFYPLDEEIISHYLVNKIKGNSDLVDHVINEVDVYQHEPWNLPYYSRRRANDQVWFFFCHLHCSNSGRVNRKTRSGNGFWKATGKVRVIRASDSGVEIGNKRTLVFYRRDSREYVKTDWVTHEYSAITDVPSQLVLWKLKNKGDGWTENEQIDKGEFGEQEDFEVKYAAQNAGMERNAEFGSDHFQMCRNPDGETNQSKENEEEEDPKALEFANSCLNDEEIVEFSGGSNSQET